MPKSPMKHSIISQTKDTAQTHGWIQSTDGRIGFVPRYDMGIELCERAYERPESPGVDSCIDHLGNALAYWLGQRVDYIPQPCVSPEFFDNLTLEHQAIVYWSELDELRRQSKAVTFHLVSRNLESCIENSEDTILLALRLRQAIEVLWWSLYLSYGCNVAFTLLEKDLTAAGKKYASLVSDRLERFVRGWFSVGEERTTPEPWSDARPPITADETLPENNLQIVKLRELAQFWTEQIAVNLPEHGTAIRDASKTLSGVYEYLNGWTHLTPLLVNSAVGFEHEKKTLPENSELLRRSMEALQVLTERCLLNERWRSLSYLKLIEQFLDSNSADAAQIELPDLEMMMHKSKAVEVELADGTYVKPFPKR